MALSGNAFAGQARRHLTALDACRPTGKPHSTLNESGLP